MNKPDLKLYILPLYRNIENSIHDIYINSKYLNNTLDLSWLNQALDLISSKFNIKQIEITGGEIGLLSDLYTGLIINLAKSYTKKLYVSTSFITFNKSLINSCNILNINYDWNGYNNITTKVLDNIKAVSSSHIINLKSFDISCRDNKLNIIKNINNLGVKSWEIIPYHPGLESSYSFDGYKKYEKLIKDYLMLSKSMHFAFQNKLQLENVLPIDNFNTKNIFITPNNKYALQKITKDNKIYLDEYDNLDEICKKIKELEKLKDNICLNCTSKLTCLANYFFNTNDTLYSCCGGKELIKEFNDESNVFSSFPRKF